MKNVLKMVMLAGLVSSQVVAMPINNQTQTAPQPEVQVSAGFVASVSEGVEAVKTWIKENPYKVAAALAVAGVTAGTYFDLKFADDKVAEDSKFVFLNGLGFRKATGYNFVAGKYAEYKAARQIKAKADEETKGREKILAEEIEDFRRQVGSGLKAVMNGFDPANVAGAEAGGGAAASSPLYLTNQANQTPTSAEGATAPATLVEHSTPDSVDLNPAGNQNSSQQSNENEESESEEEEEHTNVEDEE